MKALTLTEPFATLVAIGAKTIETRTWATPYRGPLAIHAGKGFNSEDLQFAEHNEFCRSALEAARVTIFPHGHGRGFVWGAFPESRGHVLAIANLVGCYAMASPEISGAGYFTPDGAGDFRFVEASASDVALGVWKLGRFAWVLEDARRFENPIPARGAQSLWEWEPPAETRGAG